MIISIIVPCYNCESTIKRCVDSILRIKGDIEIVLIDDGSKDATPEMCDEFAEQNGNVVVVHQENGGLVRAWKKGVDVAGGEYVTFCDSDDYLDDDYLERVSEPLNKYTPDIIIYGMKLEYADGSPIKKDNFVSEGLYEKEDLEYLKNRLLFNGKMQSKIIIGSRCAKLFSRTMLIKYMDLINDELTFGEDTVTTYVTVMNANSIYVMRNWLPYHYIRNDNSMIGKHDELWYEKLLLLRKELLLLTDIFKYDHIWQVENYFFSDVLLYIKKEIIRSGLGYKRINERMRRIRDDTALVEALGRISVREYSMISKLFAKLFIYRMNLLLYGLTKIADRMGFGKQ